jgi:hypothetical protein
MKVQWQVTVLRHQLIVLKRRLCSRARLTNNDRWFLVQLSGWFPSILQVVTIVRPEPLVRWQRAGFRYYWRWKSHPWVDDRRSNRAARIDPAEVRRRSALGRARIYGAAQARV